MPIFGKYWLDPINLERAGPDFAELGPVCGDVEPSALALCVAALDGGRYGVIDVEPLAAGRNDQTFVEFESIELAPVPVPATALLLLGGVAALAGLGRRRAEAARQGGGASNLDAPATL